MLEPKLLNEIQIENAVIPRSADIVAQPFSEWVRTKKAGIKVRVEELSGPECERRIEASLRGMTSLGWEELCESVNENGFRFTVSNFVSEWSIQTYFDECGVEKWDADFQRCGHAHSIGVLENVIDEKRLQIHFQDSVIFIMKRATEHTLSVGHPRMSADCCRAEPLAEAPWKETTLLILVHEICPVGILNEEIGIETAKKFSGAAEIGCLMGVARVSTAHSRRNEAAVEESRRCGERREQRKIEGSRQKVRHRRRRKERR